MICRIAPMLRDLARYNDLRRTRETYLHNEVPDPYEITTTDGKRWYLYNGDSAGDGVLIFTGSLSLMKERLAQLFVELEKEGRERIDAVAKDIPRVAQMIDRLTSLYEGKEPRMTSQQSDALVGLFQKLDDFNKFAKTAADMDPENDLKTTFSKEGYKLSTDGINDDSTWTLEDLENTEEAVSGTIAEVVTWMDSQMAESIKEHQGDVETARKSYEDVKEKFESLARLTKR